MGANVNIGIIGWGYWGPKLARNLDSLPHTVLTFVADIDPNRAAKAQSELPDIRVSDDPEDLLRSDVDGVVIATPLRTHYDLARRALLAGKHVLVEKPLTDDVGQAAALVELAIQLNRVLMVGHTLEYSPAVNELRALVRDGQMGRISLVEAERLNLGIFRNDIDVIWDLAPHDVSILNYVLGESPIAVRAWGHGHLRRLIVDDAHIEMEYPSGTTAHIHVSWMHPTKVRRVTLIADKRMAVYDDTNPAEMLRLFNMGADVDADPAVSYRRGEIIIPHIAWVEPLRMQCEDFVSAIEYGTVPRASGQVAVGVVAVIAAAHESLAKASSEWITVQSWTAGAHTISTTRETKISQEVVASRAHPTTSTSQPPSTVPSEDQPLVVNPAPEPPVSGLSAGVEEVAFSVFQPKEVSIGRWETLLVYISADDVKLLDAITVDVTERIAGHAGPFRGSIKSGHTAIPRGTELLIMPSLPNFTFNPPQLKVNWEEDIQCHEFRFQSKGAQPGISVNGEVRVFVGPCLFAVVPISVFVGAITDRRDQPNLPSNIARAIARAYRHIFASYAHKDIEIVKLFQETVERLGDRYFIDVAALRSGQDWAPELHHAIDSATVFQLFWSQAAAESEYVAREWRYALQLESKRPRFIRPLYWSLEPYTIPLELEHIHFERLHLEHLGW